MSSFHFELSVVESGRIEQFQGLFLVVCGVAHLSSSNHDNPLLVELGESLGVQRITAHQLSVIVSRDYGHCSGQYYGFVIDSYR